jgi:hypothetical protein
MTDRGYGLFDSSSSDDEQHPPSKRAAVRVIGLPIDVATDQLRQSGFLTIYIIPPSPPPIDSPKPPAMSANYCPERVVVMTDERNIVVTVHVG